jgi:hypothetical protein
MRLASSLSADGAQGTQSRCNFWDTGASLSSDLGLLALFSDGMHVAVRPMTLCGGPASNKTCQPPANLVGFSKDTTARFPRTRSSLGLEVGRVQQRTA